MKRMVIGKIATVREDPRRRIDEFNSFEGGFSIQRFTIHTAIPLGNHYHEHKNETFVILKGSGRVKLVPIPPDEKEMHKMPGPGYDRTTEEDISQGSVIHIKAGIAHQFILEPGSEMICFSSAPFDENNKDLVEFKIA